MWKMVTVDIKRHTIFNLNVKKLDFSCVQYFLNFVCFMFRLKQNLFGLGLGYIKRYTLLYMEEDFVLINLSVCPQLCPSFTFCTAVYISLTSGEGETDLPVEGRPLSCVKSLLQLFHQSGPTWQAKQAHFMHPSLPYERGTLLHHQRNQAHAVAPLVQHRLLQTLTKDACKRGGVHRPRTGWLSQSGMDFEAPGDNDWHVGTCVSKRNRHVYL